MQINLAGQWRNKYHCQRANARIMKFRLKRVAIISEISDAKVKAIAKALDCIKEKHEYVIVPSVIDESVIASQIKLKGK